MGPAYPPLCGTVTAAATEVATATPTVAGAIDSISFQTVSGAPWTWSCASCAPTGCAIIATNVAAAAPPASACGNDPVELALSTLPLGIGDGPDYYVNGMSCSWVVRANGPISIRFSEFITESDMDWVKVYDGTSTTAPLLNSFSGDSLRLSSLRAAARCSSPSPLTHCQRAVSIGASPPRSPLPPSMRPRSSSARCLQCWATCDASAA